jgi:hypothetical protein
MEGGDGVIKAPSEYERDLELYRMEIGLWRGRAEAAERRLSRASTRLMELSMPCKGRTMRAVEAAIAGVMRDMREGGR